MLGESREVNKPSGRHGRCGGGQHLYPPRCYQRMVPCTVCL